MEKKLSGLQCWVRNDNMCKASCDLRLLMMMNGLRQKYTLIYTGGEQAIERQV